MRKSLSLLAFCTVFSVAAFAEDYAGKLIDSNCYSQTKKATGCDATSETTMFALDVAGKVYMLDASGNSKAASAVKNRADRAADPGKPESKQIMAKVSGTETGGTITVDTVEVQ